jgi:hypothetical protein
MPYSAKRSTHSLRISCISLASTVVIASGAALVAAAPQVSIQASLATSARPAPTTRAVRVQVPVVLDGRLDDEVWKSGTAVRDFVQLEPDEGKAATEQTEIRIAYDDNAVYVGARMFDREPARIFRRLSRRDDDGGSDKLSVGFDPRHDHLTGVIFTVTAAGSLSDGIIYDDIHTDDSWDGVWDAKVAVDDQGWTAEFRIPFSQLRFSEGDRQTWGFNAGRFIQRHNEEDWWVMTPSKESGLASRFGNVEGMDGIKGRRHLDLLPYASSRGEFLGTAEPGDPFNDGRRGIAGAGIDVKWGVTSSLTLDATANPDFGQVEVDPAVVNLSAFETFYEEKRPFFIEGSNLFDSFGRNGPNNSMGFNRANPTLFYSRRVGRAPQGGASGEYVDRPTATTILGAAKLTGKTAGGWSLNLIDAITGAESAQVANGLERSTAEVEPFTNYLAARVRRDIGQRAGIGLLATSVVRSLSDPALARRLASDALVVGGDAHWFLNKRRDWVMTGSASGSRVSGSQAAMERVQRGSAHYFQRPDAAQVQLDPSARSVSGWMTQFDFNKNTGTFRPNASLWAVSPGFESNDAGFMSRADSAGSHLAFIWSKPTPDRFSRSRYLLVSKWWSWNFARELQGDGLYTSGSATMRNYWGVRATLHSGRSTYADRQTRGGPSLRNPHFWSADLALETDDRKPASVEIDGSYSSSGLGGWGSSVSIGLSLRPTSSLSIETGPAISREYTPTQYVSASADPAATAMYGSRYVFGDLDQTEIVMETRVNYIITPRMSFQLYAQPLLSNGRYWGFKEPERPRTLSYLRYGQDIGSIRYDALTRRYTVDPQAAGGTEPFGFSNPDFNYKSLRMNAVFRWEFRLGSTLYVVWTQQREDTERPGQADLSQDLSSMFGAPGDNVLMVKVSYWFSR